MKRTFADAFYYLALLNNRADTLLGFLLASERRE